MPDILVVPNERLPEADEPLQGALDWLIEIRSTDQSTLRLQEKILHCLHHDTQLAWLIDLQKRQIWVWQDDQLPLIYGGINTLPTMDIVSVLTVEDVIAMTKRSK